MFDVIMAIFCFIILIIFLGLIYLIVTLKGSHFIYHPNDRIPFDRNFYRAIENTNKKVLEKNIIPDLLPEATNLWQIDRHNEPSVAQRVNTTHLIYGQENRIKAINLIETERRQRLFGCCLIKRLFPLLMINADSESGQASNYYQSRISEIIDSVEQYSDEGDRNQLHSASTITHAIYNKIIFDLYHGETIISMVQNLVTLETNFVPTNIERLLLSMTLTTNLIAKTPIETEQICQSQLYALFLPVEIDINWKTNSVTELATQFYNGNTTIAPILADELEETGCNNTLWLRILRECPEVYHKGMTFIDNLLGK